MKERRQLPPRITRRALFLAFTLSGFAGLIYESIWSHYLKLLLGHAAYAQTLVLVLFMGGMAIGSWLCGRISGRITQPLLAYAAVELILGAMGFSFDPMYRGVASWVIESAAPALASEAAIEMLKWSIAGFMLLPPCVLLGATFPLISAAVVRLVPEEAGNALGWLYFTNSLGAVVGVLTSGFVLISWVGLPGTLFTAGLCNFALAFVVYAISRRIVTPPVQATRLIVDAADMRPAVSINVMLAIAFLTGTASFFYEIGWIRMLSLVLGSATHSFELMLGAFILGLALGALYIRNRIDRVDHPGRLLAWIQVLMGTAALGTLVVYGWSFAWMGAIVQTLVKSGTGYVWFNVLSQSICIVLMLPVTFFAGMTLPIITASILRMSAEESAIGRVYAANTWGAIAGVVLAVHLVLPTLGLRMVIVIGAGVDIALGVYLFALLRPRTTWLQKIALALLLLACVGIGSFSRFKPSQLASGVYRNGVAESTGDIIFHRDGRTASIDVTKRTDGTMLILTNGKPDAALREDLPTQDDYTMVLAGLLPLSMNPGAKRVAVVGLGSGRSTHVLLGSRHVESVDTIEIEPAMAAGARQFGSLVSRTFEDPRSHVHFEDAKTFFARYQKKYDIITAEPSNPWVSGVASLFSQEFYQQVTHYLAPGGIFVQWLQLYEFDESLVASVTGALEQAFEDFAIYSTNSADVLIVAVPRGTVPAPDDRILAEPEIHDLAESIHVRSVQDLRIRLLGTRKTVGPFLALEGSPPNSDYFPYLDQHAARFRFLGGVAHALEGAHPVSHRFAEDPVRYSEVTFSPAVPAAIRAEEARDLAAYLDTYYGSGKVKLPNIAASVIENGAALAGVVHHCDRLTVKAFWKPKLQEIATRLWPYIGPSDAKVVTTILRRNACAGDAKTIVDDWLDLLDSIADRDWANVSSRGAALAASEGAAGVRPSAFLVREVMLADYRRLGQGGLLLRTALLRHQLPDDPSIRFLKALGEAGSPIAAASYPGDYPTWSVGIR